MLASTIHFTSRQTQTRVFPNAVACSVAYPSATKENQKSQKSLRGDPLDMDVPHPWIRQLQVERRR
jgi:hypothetical protein